MKKWLLILGCSLMLAGCTKSTIVDRGGELAPDLETRAGIEFDWQQAFDEMGSEYVDDEEVLDLSFFKNEEDDGSETVYMNVLVDSSMSPQAGADLAAGMIKGLNDVLADQDFSMGRSSSVSYGDLLTRYNVGIRVIPEDQKEDQSMALVDDVIQIGEAYRPVKTNR